MSDKSPSPNKGKSKKGGYMMPDPKVIGDQYDIMIDHKEAQLEHEEEDRKTKAIFAAIQDHSGLIAQQEALHVQLDKKNREIDRLMILLDACEPVPGLSAEKFAKLLATSDENCDYRDSKIVDLAKKVRRLTVSVNKEKAANESNQTTISELTTKCERLQREIDTGLLPAARTSSGRAARDRSHLLAQLASSSTSEDIESEFAKLQKELSHTQKSNEDLKKKLAILNEENKTLTRTLTKELGDGMSLEQAVDSGWRGRAQQIVMLKAKVKKLESQLSQEAPLNPLGFKSSHRNNDVDTKAEVDLANMNLDRKAAVEAITEENARLHEKCNELESKQKASKARIKNLEVEISKQKNQLQIMVDKSQSDDELLDAYKEETDKLKAQLTQLISEKRESLRNGTGAFVKDNTLTSVKVNPDGTLTSKKLPSTNTVSDAHSPRELELQRLKRLCKQQAEQLETQDRIIQQLRQAMAADDY